MTTVALPINETLRELDSRESNGIAVVLLWDSSRDGIYVDVVDAHTLEQLRFAVPPEQALDAFHHPFAHAAMQGLLYLHEIVLDDVDVDELA